MVGKGSSAIFTASMNIMSRQSTIKKETNNLFPVFLKLENLHLLIVGGGYVGTEKLNAVLQNSPAAHVTLVATEISEPIKAIAAENPRITLVETPFQPAHLESKELVIIGINDKNVSKDIHAAVKAAGLLVNVADTPALCDFYLGSVVKKGNLKIAISTNGKSPTIARRVKDMLAEMVPEEIDELLDNIQIIRAGMQGDFEEKVRQLNELTKGLVPTSKA